MLEFKHIYLDKYIHAYAKSSTKLNGNYSMMPKLCNIVMKYGSLNIVF